MFLCWRLKHPHLRHPQVYNRQNDAYSVHHGVCQCTWRKLFSRAMARKWNVFNFRHKLNRIWNYYDNFSCNEKNTVHRVHIVSFVCPSSSVHTNPLTFPCCYFQWIPFIVLFFSRALFFPVFLFVALTYIVLFSFIFDEARTLSSISPFIECHRFWFDRQWQRTTVKTVIGAAMRHTYAETINTIINHIRCDFFSSHSFFTAFLVLRRFDMFA